MNMKKCNFLAYFNSVRFNSRPISIRDPAGSVDFKGDVLNYAAAATASLHIPVANHPTIVTRYHVLVSVLRLEYLRLTVFTNAIH